MLSICGSRVVLKGLATNSALVLTDDMMLQKIGQAMITSRMITPYGKSTDA